MAIVTPLGALFAALEQHRIDCWRKGCHPMYPHGDVGDDKTKVPDDCGPPAEPYGGNERMMLYMGNAGERYGSKEQHEKWLKRAIGRKPRTRRVRSGKAIHGANQPDGEGAGEH